MWLGYPGDALSSRHFPVCLWLHESLFRPAAVRSVKLGDYRLSSHDETMALCFFLVIVILTIIYSFSLTCVGIDPKTAFGACACMINGVGLGFGLGGPTESFDFLPAWGKWMSCLWMFLGRLEFFAVLVLLVPKFWRQR